MGNAHFIAWLNEHNWKICSEDYNGGWKPMALRTDTLLSMYADSAAVNKTQLVKRLEAAVKNPHTIDPSGLPATVTSLLSEALSTLKPEGGQISGETHAKRTVYQIEFDEEVERQANEQISAAMPDVFDDLRSDVQEEMVTARKAVRISRERVSATEQISGEVEPFGYFCECKGADPAFLRKPSWIPPTDALHTTTPLYTHPSPSEQISGEAVERVARAMYEKEHAQLKNCWSWDDSGLDEEHPLVRPRFIRLAKAAIEALETRHE